MTPVDGSGPPGAPRDGRTARAWHHRVMRQRSGRALGNVLGWFATTLLAGFGLLLVVSALVRAATA